MESETMSQQRSRIFRVAVQRENFKYQAPRLPILRVVFLKFHAVKALLFVCWACWVLVASRTCSSCGVCCSLQASLRSVFSCSREWALESRRQWLWHTGSAALGQVASPWTRYRTCVLCIGRWTVNHWTSRETLSKAFSVTDSLINSFHRYLSSPCISCVLNTVLDAENRAMIKLINDPVLTERTF